VRICFITNPQGLHARRWITALAQRGIEVHVICPAPWDIGGVTVHVLPIYTRGILRQAANLLRVRKLLRNLRPTIIHVFGLFEVNSLGTMWLPWGLPNIMISVLGSDIVPPGDGESTIERWVKQFLLRQARCIVATSRYLAEQTSRYVRPRHTINVITWGVDLVQLTPSRSSRAQEVVVGFVKRMHHLAGPDILLRAFAAAVAQAPEIRQLRMAGDGPMLTELKKLAEDLGVQSHIVWSGWIEDPAELAKLYHACDLVVMPSRRESFGMAAVEAAACGLPVIASRFGGIPEIVEHGKTGLLVEPQDVAALTAALVQLSNDPAGRARMGAAARQRAETCFDWNRSLYEMKQLYQTMSGEAV
jgi:glycosyltransferase involved in cell wall biosynthesis